MKKIYKIENILPERVADLAVKLHASRLVFE